jgi:hypothetical protein
MTSDIVKRRRVPAIFLGLVIASSAQAQSDNGVRWKATICGAKTTCAITKVTSAGQSPAGEELTVVEAHLGLANKLEDAPDEGCKVGDSDKLDGGTEYWLIDGKKPPEQILQLCNDGYGGSGVGSDQIEIGKNMMTHVQYGGAGERWEKSETIALSPRHLLKATSSNYFAGNPDVSSTWSIDVATMTTVSEESREATGGAESVPKKGFAIPVAATGDDTKNDYVPGAPLGNCAMEFRGDDGAGYLVFGAADPQRRPIIRLLALDDRTLLIQVHDPRPAQSGDSWVSSDHVEIWRQNGSNGNLTDSYNPSPVKPEQIGIGLDGSVHPGVGNPVVPEVTSAKLLDEAGRDVNLLTVTWPKEGALHAGVSVVYSQADNGWQARMYATAGIAKNRPLYLPSLSRIPVKCGINKGGNGASSIEGATLVSSPLSDRSAA